MSPRKLLLDSFNIAVAAADPLNIVPQHLPKPPKGRTFVVGAGKAAAAMALAVERHWPKKAVLDGIVITSYGHGLPTSRIAVHEAGHPIPDEQGERAAKKILVKVKQLGTDDLLLCLVSGGGSSLLSLPVAGISLSELKSVTRELLRCGAAIQEINTVRKHLSSIQGGRLELDSILTFVSSTGRRVAAANDKMTKSQHSQRQRTGLRATRSVGYQKPEQRGRSLSRRGIPDQEW